ncbi:MAG: hypothetical protein ACYS29_00850 [Planctomycetota bacterium]
MKNFHNEKPHGLEAHATGRIRPWAGVVGKRSLHFGRDDGGDSVGMTGEGTYIIEHRWRQDRPGSTCNLEKVLLTCDSQKTQRCY